VDRSFSRPSTQELNVNVPRKLIVLLFATLSVCGLNTATAGAAEQPNLVDVVIAYPYCGSEITVVNVAIITNVAGEPINLFAIDQLGNEHHVIDFPAGETVRFEFETHLPQTEALALEIDAAIPGHEDDAAYVQVLTKDFYDLDCRNWHEPANSPTSTVPVTSTTTSTVPATTTTVPLPEPEIGEALAITREAPVTTVVAETDAEATANQLAHTGSSLTELLIKIGLTCLIVGPFLLYYARKYRIRDRIKRRKSNIAKARLG